jgi:hypothetical protein
MARGAISQTTKARQRVIDDLHNLKLLATLAVDRKVYPSPEALQMALANMVEQACMCVRSAFELKEQQRRSYERRLTAMREELDAQGGNLRRMDHIDLSQAKSLGLVSAKAVDDEFARRRKPGALSRNLMTGGSTRPDPTEAVIGGWLPCGHPTCNRVVAAAKGYCSEHEPRQPRRFMTTNGQSVDLDSLLADQQQRRLRLQAELERTRGRITDAERRIEAFGPEEPHTYGAVDGQRVDLDQLLLNARLRNAQLDAELGHTEKQLQETQRRIEAFDRSRNAHVED